MGVLERISGQLVTFGVGVILARLLTLADYETVALLGIFTALAGVFVDPGFGGAFVASHLCSSQLARFAILVMQGMMGVGLFIALSLIFRLRGAKEIVMMLSNRINGRISFLMPIFRYLEK